MHRCPWPGSLQLHRELLCAAGQLPPALEVQAAPAAWVADMQAPSQDELLQQFRQHRDVKSGPLPGEARLVMASVLMGSRTPACMADEVLLCYQQNLAGQRAGADCVAAGGDENQDPNLESTPAGAKSTAKPGALLPVLQASQGLSASADVQMSEVQ